MEPSISINASLLPESQPTQIVREALRGGANAPRQVTQEEPEVHVEENLTSSDVKSTPHYHYHGLAVTQSPTQPDGFGYKESHGSQETTRSSVAGAEQSAASLDHLAPPLSPRSPADTNDPPGSPSPSKAGKAISFVSPKRPPVTPLRKSRSLQAPTRRSPSPQSQDSFAGSTPVNPEAVFLAKSKRFTLPLSQHEHSLEDSMFSPAPSKPNLRPSLIVGTSQSSSEGSNSQNAQQVAPAQEESQPETTQYQQDTDYMEYLSSINNNRDPYIDRSGVNFPQSPDSSSSSSGNFPENGSRSCEVPTQVVGSAQSMSDLEPTQPSTQVVREIDQVPTQTDDSPADVPPKNVPHFVDSHQTTAPSTATLPNKRSLFNQLKKWRQIPGVTQLHQLPADRTQSTAVVPETPLQTGSTRTGSIGEGETRTTPSTPEPPPVDLLPRNSRTPLRSPLLSSQFMPPPPNPLRLDEDETMDIVPDSEPSRIADGSIPSMRLPGQTSLNPPLVDSDDEVVPESLGEANGSPPAQMDASLLPQDEEKRSTELETEKDDDPMNDDQLLVRQQEKLSPMSIPEEGDEEPEERVGQEGRDDDTVPETEDEVPLATVVKLGKPTPKPLPPRGRSTRNKRPIIYTESPDTSEDEGPGEPEATPVERPTKKRRVEKVGKVQANATPIATRGRGARKAKQPGSAKAVKSAAKGSATKTKPQKGRGKGKKASAEASTVTSGRDTPPVQDDEARTEPAEDDEAAGFESSDDMPPARKRKRPGPDKKPHRTASGTSTLQGVTPQRGGSKRIRSLPGSLRDITRSDCTRVFARWPLCRHFYVGSVHSRSHIQSDLYVVRFDDGTECPVHISDLRQGELEEGDEVFVIGYKQSGRVTATDRWDVEGYVKVKLDTGGELDVKASSIKIHESVIDERWGERLIHEHSIRTSLQAQGHNSSTSKSATVKGTSTSKFLKRIGFVVTMKSPNDKDRTRLAELIKNNGGKVIDDWANLFSPSPTQTGGSWVAHRADVRHKDLGVHTVFLLADEPNQKPKYLMALALGIPCVSTEWLLECTNQHALINWNDHLLPAGEYPWGLMSQRVNLRWGDKSQQLHETYTDIYGSNSTLLGEKAILCIGLELFPPGKSKGLKRNNTDDDRQNKSTRELPGIMLAMGADQVEAVCDLKDAQHEITDYDFVLVKDLEEVKKFSCAVKGERPPCVHIPWIKECLVAGRLLDVPKLAS